MFPQARLRYKTKLIREWVRVLWGNRGRVDDSDPGDPGANVPSPTRTNDLADLAVSWNGSEKRRMPSSTGPSKSSTGPPSPNIPHTADIDQCVRGNEERWTTHNPGLFNSPPSPTESVIIIVKLFLPKWAGKDMVSTYS